MYKESVRFLCINQINFFFIFFINNQEFLFILFYYHFFFFLQKCEREFKEYIKDKMVAAKADIRELLQVSFTIITPFIKSAFLLEYHFLVFTLH